MSITLESVKAEQEKLAQMIAALEEAAKKPAFFEYNDARIPLKQGEIYVGTILTPGAYGNYHLILLAGETQSETWGGAIEWAKAQGGELPNRVESALLFQTLKSEFSENGYWTRDSHENDNAYAWCQYFLFGFQTSLHKYGRVGARAVRRLPI